MTMEVFKDYAYYYNVFYQDKNYSEEARQVDYLLRKYGTNIHTVVDYGCGTGKHDIELAKLGYQCSGIDMSPLMIDIAKENVRAVAEDINLKVADIRKYIPQNKYDAVISLFHVMSYQNSNQDAVSAFKSARKALKQGGIFLFDLWYGPGVLSDKPSIRVKEIEDEEHKLVRIARPIMYDKTNVVSVCYEVFVINKESGETKVINEVHNMRYFFRPEVEVLLKEAEFELIENLDCKTLEATDYNSWTSYFIAKAI